MFSLKNIDKNVCECSRKKNRLIFEIYLQLFENPDFKNISVQ